MDKELTNKIAELEEKIDKMYLTVEKLRKYFFWTGVITIVLFVVPLIGLVFAIPSFIHNYTQTLNDPGF